MTKALFLAYNTASITASHNPNEDVGVPSFF